VYSQTFFTFSEHFYFVIIIISDLTEYLFRNIPNEDKKWNAISGEQIYDSRL